MAFLTQGALVAAVGVVGTAGVCTGLEELEVLRQPKFTCPALMAVSTGYVALGVGIGVIRYSERRIVASRLIRELMETTWKQLTFDKASLKGNQLQGLAKEAVHSKWFERLFELQSSKANVWSQFVLPRKDLSNALLEQVAPFCKSEKVVPARLTKALCDAAENAALQHLRITQDRFVLSVLSVMTVFNMLIVGIDHNALVDLSPTFWKKENTTKNSNSNSNSNSDSDSDSDCNYNSNSDNM